MAIPNLTQLSPDQKEECVLFEWIPNFVSPISKIPVSGLEAIANNPVIVQQVDTNKSIYNSMRFEMEFLFKGYEDLKDMYDFFEDMQGKNRSFCLPSWTTDLVVSQPALSGATSITLESVEPHIYVGCNLFFNLDGDYFVREITNIVGLVVTLDSPIPEDISAETPISIVYRVTFAQDDLNILYVTNDSATATIAFVEERREPSQEGEELS